MAPLGRRPRLCVACAPPPPAPRPHNALPPPPPAPVPPSLASRSGQPIYGLFPPLSHPMPAPERHSAVVPTTQLYLKGLVDLALLVYSVVLFSFLRDPEPHTIPGPGAEVRDTEGREGGEVWGAGVCGCVPFGGGVWGVVSLSF
jgi:hypothetical protein